MESHLLEKIKSFCAFQERSVLEIKQKLTSLGVLIPDPYLEILQAEGYQDELRFAKHFAGSKFRIKRWGREKISQQLYLRGLDEGFVAEALNEIPEEEYMEAATALAEKYLATRFGVLRPDVRLYKYLRQKGYEHEIAFRVNQ